MSEEIPISIGPVPTMTPQEVLEKNTPSVGLPKTIEEGRTIFKFQLNIAIERIRTVFTTPGSVQAMVYEEKVAEATDYLVNSDDVSKYPLLALEADITGKSAKQVADNILSQRAKWIQLICKTEAIKLNALKKMQRARSYDGVVKAFKAAQLEIKEFDL